MHLHIENHIIKEKEKIQIKNIIWYGIRTVNSETFVFVLFSNALKWINCSRYFIEPIEQHSRTIYTSKKKRKIKNWINFDNLVLQIEEVIPLFRSFNCFMFKSMDSLDVNTRRQRLWIEEFGWIYVVYAFRCDKCLFTWILDAFACSITWNNFSIALFFAFAQYEIYALISLHAANVNKPCSFICVGKTISICVLAFASITSPFLLICIQIKENNEWMWWSFKSSLTCRVYSPCPTFVQRKPYNTRNSKRKRKKPFFLSTKESTAIVPPHAKCCQSINKRTFNSFSSGHSPLCIPFTKSILKWIKNR